MSEKKDVNEKQNKQSELKFITLKEGIDVTKNIVIFISLLEKLQSIIKNILDAI